MAAFAPLLKKQRSAGVVDALRSSLIVGLVIVGFVTTSVAQPAHRSSKRSQPASTIHAAPDVTATIPSRGSSKASGTGEPASKDVLSASKASVARLASLPDPSAPDTEPLPPEFKLPSATRAQMRECGLRWRQMKLDGQTGEEIWRDFATTCLASTGNAVITPSTIVTPTLSHVRDRD